MQGGTAEANSPEGELNYENGLVVRQVPMIRKLVYDANSSDFMIYKRKKVARPSKEQNARGDFDSLTRLEAVIEAQRERIAKQMTSESLMSEERMICDENRHHLIDEEASQAGHARSLEVSPNHEGKDQLLQIPQGEVSLENAPLSSAKPEEGSQSAMNNAFKGSEQPEN